MNETDICKYNIYLYNTSKFINTTGNLVYPLITYILLKTLNIQEQYIGILIMVITIIKIPIYCSWIFSVFNKIYVISG